MIRISFHHEDGEEVKYDFPSKMQVCHDCEGQGTVLTPSMRHYAYSAEEFMAEFEVEEQDEYFRTGGRFDVECPTCHGKNVEKVIDIEACQQHPEHMEMLNKWERVQQDLAQMFAEEAAERRMGA